MTLRRLLRSGADPDRRNWNPEDQWRANEGSMKVIDEPANQKEKELIKTYLKEAEIFLIDELKEEYAEMAEKHEKRIQHNSLMEYSNIQLDFIKVFGERVFVMVIGKSNI